LQRPTSFIIFALDGGIGLTFLLHKGSSDYFECHELSKLATNNENIANVEEQYALVLMEVYKLWSRQIDFQWELANI
jgi:hypothetical protein